MTNLITRSIQWLELLLLRHGARLRTLATKTIAVAVTACLLVNIAELGVYAATDPEKDIKKIVEQKYSDIVFNSYWSQTPRAVMAPTSFSPTKNGELVMKDDELIGFVQDGIAYTVQPGGKFVENAYITQEYATAQKEAAKKGGVLQGTPDLSTGQQVIKALEGIQESLKKGWDALSDWQKMVLVTLGIVKDPQDTGELNKLSSKLGDAISYLKSVNADAVVNCAANALGTVLGPMQKGFLALQSILVDVSTGSFMQNQKHDGNVYTSLDAVVKAAKADGLDMTAYTTTAGNEKDALKTGNVIQVNGNHFVTITGIQNGQVTYSDNGKTRTVSEEEFLKMATNSGTTQVNFAAATGSVATAQKMDSATAQRTTGARVVCCFAAGTPVLMADGTRKAIEKVAVGEALLGYDGKKNVPVVVTELIQPLRDHLYLLTFEDGNTLQITSDHPLYTEQGWKSISLENSIYVREGLPVSELKTGDKVLRNDGSYAKLRSMEYKPGLVQTYSFKVTVTANYYANGFLAHNCGGGSSSGSSNYYADYYYHLYGGGGSSSSGSKSSGNKGSGGNNSGSNSGNSSGSSNYYADYYANQAREAQRAAEIAAERARQERIRAEQERVRKEQERIRAEQERIRREQERLHAQQAKKNQTTAEAQQTAVAKAALEASKRQLAADAKKLADEQLASSQTAAKEAKEAEEAAKKDPSKQEAAKQRRAEAVQAAAALNDTQKLVSSVRETTKDTLSSDDKAALKASEDAAKSYVNTVKSGKSDLGTLSESEKLHVDKGSQYDGIFNDETLTEAQKVQVVNNIEAINYWRALGPGRGVQIDPSSITGANISFDKDGNVQFKDIKVTYYGYSGDTQVQIPGTFTGVYKGGYLDGNVTVTDPSSARLDVNYKNPGNGESTTTGPASDAQTVATMEIDGNKVHLSNIEQIGIQQGLAKDVGSGDIAKEGSKLNGGQTVTSGYVYVSPTGTAQASATKGDDGKWKAGGTALVNYTVQGNQGTTATFGLKYDGTGFAGYTSLGAGKQGESFKLYYYNPQMPNANGMQLNFTYNAGTFTFAGNGSAYNMPAGGTVTFAKDFNLTLTSSFSTSTYATKVTASYTGNLTSNYSGKDAAGHKVTVTQAVNCGAAGTPAVYDFDAGSITSGGLNSEKTTKTYVDGSHFVQETAKTTTDVSGDRTYYDITMQVGNEKKVDVHGAYSEQQVASLYNTIFSLGVNGFSSITSVNSGMQVNLTAAGKQATAEAANVGVAAVNDQFTITEQTPIANLASIYAAMHPADLSLTVADVSNKVVIDNDYAMDSKTGMLYKKSGDGSYQLVGLADSKGNIYAINSNGTIGSTPDSALTTKFQTFAESMKTAYTNASSHGVASGFENVTAAYQMIQSMSVNFINPLTIGSTGGVAEVKQLKELIDGIMTDGTMSSDEKTVKTALLAAVATGQSFNLQAWATQGAATFIDTLGTIVYKGEQYINDSLTAGINSGVTTLRQLLQGVLVDSVTGNLQDRNNPFSLSSLAAQVVTGSFSSYYLTVGWSRDSLGRIEDYLALGYTVTVTGFAGLQQLTPADYKTVQNLGKTADTLANLHKGETGYDPFASLTYSDFTNEDGTTSKVFRFTDAVVSDSLAGNGLFTLDQGQKLDIILTADGKVMAVSNAAVTGSATDSAGTVHAGGSFTGIECSLTGGGFSVTGFEYHVAGSDNGGFQVNDPKGDASGTGAGKAPTVKTAGVFTRNADGYSISGKDSVISLRNGQWMAVGAGAEAWDGSTLSVGGVTVTTKGSYTFNGTAWNPTDASDTATGWKISPDALKDYDFQLTSPSVLNNYVHGAIPATLDDMLLAIAANPPDNAYELAYSNWQPRIEMVATRDTVRNGVVIPAGTKVELWNSSTGKKGLYATAELTVGLKAPAGWNVGDILPDSLTIYAGQEISLATGAFNYQQTSGTREIFTNTVEMTWNGVTYKAGELKISAGYVAQPKMTWDGKPVIGTDGQPEYEVTDRIGLVLENDTYTMTDQATGNKFTYLAGSQVAMTENGIVATNAIVKTSGARMVNPAASSGGGAGSDGKTGIMAVGSMDRNNRFTGTFYHVSDAAVSSLFTTSVLMSSGSRVIWEEGSFNPALGAITGGRLETVVDGNGKVWGNALAGATVTTTKAVYDGRDLRGYNINTYNAEGLATSAFEIAKGCVLPPDMVNGRIGVAVQTGTFRINYEVKDGQIVMKDGQPNGTPVVSDDFKAVWTFSDGQHVYTTEFLKGGADALHGGYGFGEVYKKDGVELSSVTQWDPKMGVVLRDGDNYINLRDDRVIKGEHSSSAYSYADGNGNLMTMPADKYTFGDCTITRLRDTDVSSISAKNAYFYLYSNTVQQDGKAVTREWVRSFEESGATVDVMLGEQPKEHPEDPSIMVDLKGNRIVVTIEDTDRITMMAAGLLPSTAKVDPFYTARHGQVDTYKVSGFKGAPAGEQTGGSEPKPEDFAPFAVTALYKSADGHFSSQQLGSLGLPEITGRSDGQFQRWGTVIMEKNGETVQVEGVNKHVITEDGTEQNLFQGYDDKGNTVSAVYADDAQTVDRIHETFSATSVMLGTSFVQANTYNPAGELLGFLDVKKDASGVPLTASYRELTAKDREQINALKQTTRETLQTSGPVQEGSAWLDENGVLRVSLSCKAQETVEGVVYDGSKTVTGIVVSSDPDRTRISSVSFKGARMETTLTAGGDFYAYTVNYSLLQDGSIKKETVENYYTNVIKNADGTRTLHSWSLPGGAILAPGGTATERDISIDRDGRTSEQVFKGYDGEYGDRTWKDSTCTISYDRGEQTDDYGALRSVSRTTTRVTGDYQASDKTDDLKRGEYYEYNVTDAVTGAPIYRSRQWDGDSSTFRQDVWHTYDIAKGTNDCWNRYWNDGYDEKKSEERADWKGNGRRIVQTTTDANGKELAITEQAYDGNGNLRAAVTREADGNGRMEVTTSLYFTEKGDLTTAQSGERWGVQYCESAYFNGNGYDKDGNPIYQTVDDQWLEQGFGNTKLDGERIAYGIGFEDLNKQCAERGTTAAENYLKHGLSYDGKKFVQTFDNVDGTVYSQSVAPGTLFSGTEYKGYTIDEHGELISFTNINPKDYKITFVSGKGYVFNASTEGTEILVSGFDFRTDAMAGKDEEGGRYTLDGHGKVQQLFSVNGNTYIKELKLSDSGHVQKSATSNDYLINSFQVYDSNGSQIHDYKIENGVVIGEKSWLEKHGTTILKAAVSILATVVGVILVSFTSWTGIGAVAGVALISAGLTFVGVGAITYAEKGYFDAQEAAIDAIATGVFNFITFGYGSILKSIGSASVKIGAKLTGEAALAATTKSLAVEGAELTGKAALSATTKAAAVEGAEVLGGATVKAAGKGIMELAAESSIRIGGELTAQNIARQSASLMFKALDLTFFVQTAEQIRYDVAEGRVGSLVFDSLFLVTCCGPLMKMLLPGTRLAEANKLVNEAMEMAKVGKTAEAAELLARAAEWAKGVKGGTEILKAADMVAAKGITEFAEATRALSATKALGEATNLVKMGRYQEAYELAKGAELASVSTFEKIAVAANEGKEITKAMLEPLKIMKVERITGLAIGARLEYGAKQGLALAALSAVSTVGNTVLTNLETTGQFSFEGLSFGEVLVNSAMAFGFGFGVGLVSPTVARAWNNSMGGSMYQYLHTSPVTLFVNTLESAHSLAMFNATPVGALINWGLASLEGQPFDYAASVHSGFNFGLLMGPTFAMAIPGEALFSGSSKLNRFFTRWADEGILGGRATSWLSANLSPEIAGQVHMSAGVMQYWLAGKAGGMLGGIVDKAFGTEKFFSNPDGSPKGLFSSFLSGISFFLVPSHMAESAGSVRTEAVLEGRGLFGRALTDTERMRFAEKIINREVSDRFLSGEALGSFTVKARATEIEILAKDPQSRGELQKQLAEKGIDGSLSVRFRNEIEVSVDAEMAAGFTVACAELARPALGEKGVFARLPGEVIALGEKGEVALTADVYRVLAEEHVNRIAATGGIEGLEAFKAELNGIADAVRPDTAELKRLQSALKQKTELVEKLQRFETLQDTLEKTVKGSLVEGAPAAGKSEIRRELQTLRDEIVRLDPGIKLIVQGERWRENSGANVTRAESARNSAAYELAKVNSTFEYGAILADARDMAEVMQRVRIREEISARAGELRKTSASDTEVIGWLYEQGKTKHYDNQFLDTVARQESLRLAKTLLLESVSGNPGLLKEAYQSPNAEIGICAAFNVYGEIRSAILSIDAVRGNVALEKLGNMQPGQTLDRVIADSMRSAGFTQEAIDRALQSCRQSGKVDLADVRVNERLQAIPEMVDRVENEMLRSFAEYAQYSKNYDANKNALPVTLGEKFTVVNDGMARDFVIRQEGADSYFCYEVKGDRTVEGSRTQVIRGDRTVVADGVSRELTYFYDTYKDQGQVIDGKRGGQWQAIRDAVLGENIAIHAPVGYGKTAIVATIVELRAKLFGMANADMFLANIEEAKKYYNGSFNDKKASATQIRSFMERDGARVYLMDEIARSAMDTPDAEVLFNGKKMTALERFKTVMADRGGIRIWEAEQFGHLGTRAESNARSGDKVLRDILDTFRADSSRLTLADELHRFLEGQTSYILSSGEAKTLKDGFSESGKLLTARTMVDDLMRLQAEGKGTIKVGETVLSAEQAKIEFVDGQVKMTAELKTALGEWAKKVGLSSSWVVSMLKPIFELKGTGRVPFGLTVVDGNERLVPVAESIEPDRVFQDVAYAYSAAIECMKKQMKDGSLSSGSLHDAALERVSVSKTDYGTSGSRLFYGKGQIVGLSGTLDHVREMATSFGLEVREYGRDKEFRFVDAVTNAEELTNWDGMVQQVAIRSLKGDIREDAALMADDVVRGLGERNQVVQVRGDSFGEALVEALKSRLGEQVKVEFIKSDTTDTKSVIKCIDKSTGNKVIICIGDKGWMGLDYVGDFDIRMYGNGVTSTLFTQGNGRILRHAGESGTRTFYFDPVETGRILSEVSQEGMRQAMVRKLELGGMTAEAEALRKMQGTTTGDIKLDAMITMKYLTEREAASSLFFGHVDHFADKYLNQWLADKVAEVGGESSKLGRIIAQAQTDLIFGKEAVSDAITSQGEIVDPMRQAELSLERQKTESCAVLNSLLARLSSVKGDPAVERLISETREYRKVWENIAPRPEAKDGPTIITRAGSLQEAVDVLFHYAGEMLPTLGHEGNFGSAPRTVRTADLALREAGVTAEGLSRMREVLQQGRYSMGERLTYAGQKYVSNVIAATRWTAANIENMAAYLTAAGMPGDDETLKGLKSLQADGGPVPSSLAARIAGYANGSGRELDTMLAVGAAVPLLTKAGVTLDPAAVNAMTAARKDRVAEAVSGQMKNAPSAMAIEQARFIVKAGAADKALTRDLSKMLNAYDGAIAAVYRREVPDRSAAAKMIDRFRLNSQMKDLKQFQQMRVSGLFSYATGLGAAKASGPEARSLAALFGFTVSAEDLACVEKLSAAKGAVGASFRNMKLADLPGLGRESAWEKRVDAVLAARGLLPRLMDGMAGQRTAERKMELLSRAGLSNGEIAWLLDPGLSDGIAADRPVNDALAGLLTKKIDAALAMAKERQNAMASLLDPAAIAAARSAADAAAVRLETLRKQLDGEKAGEMALVRARYAAVLSAVDAAAQQRETANDGLQKARNAAADQQAAIDQLEQRLNLLVEKILPLGERPGTVIEEIGTVQKQIAKASRALARGEKAVKEAAKKAAYYDRRYEQAKAQSVEYDDAVRLIQGTLHADLAAAEAAAQDAQRSLKELEAAEQGAAERLRHDPAMRELDETLRQAGILADIRPVLLDTDRIAALRDVAVRCGIDARTMEAVGRILAKVAQSPAPAGANRMAAVEALEKLSSLKSAGENNAIATRYFKYAVRGSCNVQQGMRPARGGTARLAVELTFTVAAAVLLLVNPPLFGLAALTLPVIGAVSPSLIAAGILSFAGSAIAGKLTAGRPAAGARPNMREMLPTMLPGLGLALPSLIHLFFPQLALAANLGQTIYGSLLLAVGAAPLAKRTIAQARADWRLQRDADNQLDRSISTLSRLLPAHPELASEITGSTVKALEGRAAVRSSDVDARVVLLQLYAAASGNDAKGLKLLTELRRSYADAEGKLPEAVVRYYDGKAAEIDTAQAASLGGGSLRTAEKMKAVVTSVMGPWQKLLSALSTRYVAKTATFNGFVRLLMEKRGLTARQAVLIVDKDLSSLVQDKDTADTLSATLLARVLQLEDKARVMRLLAALYEAGVPMTDAALQAASDAAAGAEQPVETRTIALELLNLAARGGAQIAPIALDRLFEIKNVPAQIVPAHRAMLLKTAKAVPALVLSRSERLLAAVKETDRSDVDKSVLLEMLAGALEGTRAAASSIGADLTAIVRSGDLDNAVRLQALNALSAGPALLDGRTVFALFAFAADETQPEELRSAAAAIVEEGMGGKKTAKATVESALASLVSAGTTGQQKELAARLLVRYLDDHGTLPGLEREMIGRLVSVVSSGGDLRSRAVAAGFLVTAMEYQPQLFSLEDMGRLVAVGGLIAGRIGSLTDEEGGLVGSVARIIAKAGLKGSLSGIDPVSLTALMKSPALDGDTRKALVAALLNGLGKDDTSVAAADALLAIAVGNGAGQGMSLYALELMAGLPAGAVQCFATDYGMGRLLTGLQASSDERTSALIGAILKKATANRQGQAAMIAALAGTDGSVLRKLDRTVLARTKKYAGRNISSAGAQRLMGMLAAMSSPDTVVASALDNASMYFAGKSFRLGLNPYRVPAGMLRNAEMNRLYGGNRLLFVEVSEAAAGFWEVKYRGYMVVNDGVGGGTADLYFEKQLPFGGKARVSANHVRFEIKPTGTIMVDSDMQDTEGYADYGRVYLDTVQDRFKVYTVKARAADGRKAATDGIGAAKAAPSKPGAVRGVSPASALQPVVEKKGAEQGVLSRFEAAPAARAEQPLASRLGTAAWKGLSGAVAEKLNGRGVAAGGTINCAVVAMLGLVRAADADELASKAAAIVQGLVEDLNADAGQPALRKAASVLTSEGETATLGSLMRIEQVKARISLAPVTLSSPSAVGQVLLGKRARVIAYFESVNRDGTVDQEGVGHVVVVESVDRERQTVSYFDCGPNETEPSIKTVPSAAFADLYLDKGLKFNGLLLANGEFRRSPVNKGLLTVEDPAEAKARLQARGVGNLWSNKEAVLGQLLAAQQKKGSLTTAGRELMLKAFTGFTRGEDTAALQYTLAVTRSFESLNARFGNPGSDERKIVKAYAELTDTALRSLNGRELAVQLVVLQCQRDLLLMAARDGEGAEILRQNSFDVAGLQAALKRQQLSVRQACVEWLVRELQKSGSLEMVIDVAALRKAVADKALLRHLEGVNVIRDLLNDEEKRNNKVNKRGSLLDPLAAKGIISAA